MRKRCVHWAVVVVFSFVLGGLARADGLRRVGVVTTVKVNVSAKESAALAEQMARALTDRFVVDVVAGSEADRRLPPDGVPDQCASKDGCRTDLGRRLSVDELLLLVIVQVGDRTQIDATWVDVNSGDIFSRKAIILAAGDDAKKIFAKAAPALLPHLQKRTAATPTAPMVVARAQRGDDQQRRMTRGAWVAGGVSVAALIGASIFATSAKSKHDKLERDGCATMRCSAGSIRSLRRASLAGDLLFATSVGAGITMGILYYMSGSGETARQGVGASVGATSAQLTWGTSF